jgi:hypothetical protein
MARDNYSPERHNGHLLESTFPACNTYMGNLSTTNRVAQRAHYREAQHRDVVFIRITGTRLNDSPEWVAKTSEPKRSETSESRVLPVLLEPGIIK